MAFVDNQELFMVPEENDLHLVKEGTASSEILVIILNANENKPHLLDFLRKICTAAGFDFENQVTILSIDDELHDNLSLYYLFYKYEGHPFISFGTHEEAIVTQFHKIKYQWINISNGTILFSDSLERISSNRDLKIKLWASLKNKFNN